MISTRGAAIALILTVFVVCAPSGSAQAFQEQVETDDATDGRQPTNPTAEPSSSEPAHNGSPADPLGDGTAASSGGLTDLATITASNNIEGGPGASTAPVIVIPPIQQAQRPRVDARDVQRPCAEWSTTTASSSSTAVLSAEEQAAADREVNGASSEEILAHINANSDAEDSSASSNSADGKPLKTPASLFSSRFARQESSGAQEVDVEGVFAIFAAEAAAAAAAANSVLANLPFGAGGGEQVCVWSSTTAARSESMTMSLVVSTPSRLAPTPTMSPR